MYENNELLSIKKVAQIIGVHRNSILKWVREGTFPKPVSLGTLTRWKSDEVSKWIAELPLKTAKSQEAQ